VSRSAVEALGLGLDIGTQQVLCFFFFLFFFLFRLSPLGLKPMFSSTSHYHFQFLSTCLAFHL